jgi:ABC-type uncharacterized transport system permease subunit
MLATGTYAVFFPTLILYLLAAFVLGKRLFANHSSTDSNRYALNVGFYLMAAACIGHAILVTLFSLSSESHSLSIAHVAAALSLLVTITMLVTNRYIKNHLFLPVVCGVSALFVSLLVMAPNSDKIVSSMSAGLVGHIVLSLFAFGTLSISFLYAVQLSFISHQLKTKKLHLMNKTLPPLILVEQVLEKLMVAGASLLLVSLISGFIFIPNMFADGYAHKTLLSLLSFLTYLLALVVHKKWGLRSRILVVINFIGLGLLTLAYFGSRIVSEFIL